MSDRGTDALAEAIGGVVQLLVAVIAAALFVVVPAIITLLARGFLAQGAILGLLFERLGIALHLAAPISSTMRFALTIAIYGGVIGPAVALIALSAVHLSLLFYAAIAAGVVGCVVALIGLLPSPAMEGDALRSLRFWD